MFKSYLSDVKSGFLVFLIALPLSIGISIASGFPAISGIITAVIGGCITPFLGSSKLTIKGPAAGLITIVLASTLELGNGDLVLGYKRTLAVIFMASIIQMIFSFTKIVNSSISISKSIVHGMMAAIGIIIISKQVYVLFGYGASKYNFTQTIIHLKDILANPNPVIFLIGFFALFTIFLYNKINLKYFKIIPAQILIIAIVILFSFYFHFSEGWSYSLFNHQYLIDKKYLVNIPNDLSNIISFPDFSIILNLSSIKYIAMLAIVGTIESTLTVLAIDSIDPKKNRSDLNKDLFALSCGNLISSILGGLPMISEVVRSKANVDNGAKSKYGNFFHGIFLLIFTIGFSKYLNMIPLSALAAILIYVGLRLASVSEFYHIGSLGRDQLIIFLSTILAILLTDLLTGIFIGIVIKTFIYFIIGGNFKSIFLAKISTKTFQNQSVIKMSGDANYISILRIKNCIEKIPSPNSIKIDLKNCNIIDHTFLVGINLIEKTRNNKKIEITNSCEMRSLSNHEFSTKIKIS